MHGDQPAPLHVEHRNAPMPKHLSQQTGEPQHAWQRVPLVASLANERTMSVTCTTSTTSDAQADTASVPAGAIHVAGHHDARSAFHDAGASSGSRKIGESNVAIRATTLGELVGQYRAGRPNLKCDLRETNGFPCR